MEENYHKAYKEVIEILKYVPQESVNKIPKTMLETFEKKMDKDYVFNVDINKSFEDTRSRVKQKIYLQSYLEIIGQHHIKGKE